MRTNRYHKMLQSFACDFQCALRGDKTLEALAQRLKEWDLNLIADVGKLVELAELLESGVAEIHVPEEIHLRTEEAWKVSIVKDFRK